MKTFITNIYLKTNLSLIKYPWLIILFSILYVLSLRGGVALCYGWDFPLEKDAAGLSWGDEPNYLSNSLREPSKQEIWNIMQKHRELEMQEKKIQYEAGLITQRSPLDSGYATYHKSQHKIFVKLIEHLPPLEKSDALTQYMLDEICGYKPILEDPNDPTAYFWYKDYNYFRVNVIMNNPILRTSWLGELDERDCPISIKEAKAFRELLLKHINTRFPLAYESRDENEVSEMLLHMRAHLKLIFHYQHGRFYYSVCHELIFYEELKRQRFLIHNPDFTRRDYYYRQHGPHPTCDFHG